MGFTKRNEYLETYLDSLGVSWRMLSDKEYKEIYSGINHYIDSGGIRVVYGADACEELKGKLPLSGFVLSAPVKNHIFSIYDEGGSKYAFVYSVSDLNAVERDILNRIECVVVNDDYSFACSFNHEADALCPEVYVECAV